ncbi:MAG: hypothetical protein EBR27_13460 [Betaproteobacteria bacterium]|nr:hypothetical protein [Betaproteobacteria bacterium]
MNAHQCIAPTGDDDQLCGAPATCERIVEGLLCHLCPACAAELDHDATETTTMTTSKYESGPYELDGTTRCRWHSHRSRDAAIQSAQKYARRGTAGLPAYVTAYGGGAGDGWWSGPDGVHRVRVVRDDD